MASSESGGVLVASDSTIPESTPFMMVTDDAYPLRDVSVHHLVRPIGFLVGDPTIYMWSRSMRLSPVLRMPNVLVPSVAVEALARRDYVRLGLPSTFFRMMKRSLGEQGRQLEDPLYTRKDKDDMWWVRAWPTSALATMFTVESNEPWLDAADIMRQTGQGLTVTADLKFNFFYKANLGNYQGPLLQSHVDRANRQFFALSTRPQGLVVTVVRCVVTNLHDDRPGPIRNPNVDEWRVNGCHLWSSRGQHAVQAIPEAPDPHATAANDDKAIQTIEHGLTDEQTTQRIDNSSRAMPAMPAVENDREDKQMALRTEDEPRRMEDEPRDEDGPQEYHIKPSSWTAGGRD